MEICKDLKHKVETIDQAIKVLEEMRNKLAELENTLRSDVDEAAARTIQRIAIAISAGIEDLVRFRKGFVVAAFSRGCFCWVC